MARKALISFAAATLSLIATRAAFAQSSYVAQGDSPQWLKDRRYAEGAGVRTGDLELHPSIAGETGYDSNWFLRTDKTGFANGSPLVPVVSAAVLRLTPALYLSTLGPQRREGGEGPSQPPSVRFRAGINATYREFINVSNHNEPENDVSRQRNVGGAADARVEIAPERPFGAALNGTFARVVQPNAVTADPNKSFTRDDFGGGGEFIAQPGGGTLDWRAGYQFRATKFEDSANAGGFDSTTNEAFTRGRWRFRPRTALFYDATLGFLNYSNPSQAKAQGLISSTPVRARIGLNGLVTSHFTLLVQAGWGSSFYDATAAGGKEPQYDSVIGQAELKWFLSGAPGLDKPAELGLALSSIAVGYTRDFQNSYIGNYYGVDRGYVKFAYFFAGRALLSLEGGVGAIEYPNMFWADGQLRHQSFTDTRADGTLFGEYRISDSIGINTTVRFTGNFTGASDGVPELESVPASRVSLQWNRLEAYLGARWFL